LPVERSVVLLHPNRTVAFDIANEVTDVDLFAHRDQKMAVVRRTVADDEFRFVILDDPVNVCVQPCLDLGTDQINAVLC
jgi:hypothetical protein